MTPLRVLLRAPAIGARAIAVAFAIVVIAVFAAAGDAVRDVAVGQQMLADRTAADAAAFVRGSRIRPANDRVIADGLALRMAGTGLDVQVRPRPGSSIRPVTPPVPPRPELGMAIVAAFTGAHPMHVPVGEFDVAIGPDVHALATFAKRIFAGAVMVVAVIGLVLLAVMRALNREAMRPLKDTTAALRRLAAGDFTPRPVDASHADEMGALAQAYNAAAATVASALEERRLAEVEMQRFIADAGHELKTPLAVIMGFVDVLERGDLPPETATRLYATMRAESNRMRGMIEKLIALARLGSPEPPHLDLVDAGRVADAVADSLLDVAAPRRVAVEHEGEPAIVVADENDLYDAVFNCIENALKYGGDSDVAVTVRRRAGRVTIAIRDAGPGMSADDRRRAFERFYRGERTRALPGSGLGLAIVKSVVEKFHGTVALEDVAHGTAIRIDLPAVPDAARDASPSTRA